MDRFTARRKLLRGSLSAPLVLTVASPSALARTTFEACIARAVGQAGPPYLVNADDGFFRKAVPVYRCVPDQDSVRVLTDDDCDGERKNKKKRDSVSVLNTKDDDDDDECKKKKTKRERDGEKWRDVSFVEENGVFHRLPGLKSIGMSEIPEGYKMEETGSTAGQLVFFNSDGEVVGSGLSNWGNGTPVTHSCWASFAG